MSDTNSGYRNSGDYNSGNRNSGDYNSGDYNSGNYNSGDRNSGDYNSGDYNSGDYNSGDYNSGNRNSGNYNSGNRNSGYRNSGDYNSGNRNSGLFNTDEPNARLFNKDAGITFTALKQEDSYPDFSGLELVVWVEESMMTEEEKAEYPSYKTTGGFLKEIDYKEMWAIFWRTTSEENRRKVMGLPNFDAGIFEEITGISVASSPQKQSLLDKADELIAKANELKEQANNL